MTEEKKLYVGNLEYNATEDELKKIFADKGIEVKELKIIKDRFTGKSKGFGFIELNKEDDVQPAIDSLDGQELKGRKLRVSKAHKPRPRLERDRGRQYRR